MIIADTTRLVRFFKFSALGTLSISTIIDNVGSFSGIKIYLQAAGGGGSSGASNGSDAGFSQVQFTTSRGGTFTLAAEGGKGGRSAIHTGVYGGQGFDDSFALGGRFGGSGAPGFYVSNPDFGSFTVGGASFFGGGCSRTLTGGIDSSYGAGGAGGRSEVIGVSGVTHVYGGSGSAGGYVESNFIPRDFIASSISISVGNPGNGSAGIGLLAVAGSTGVIGLCAIAIYK